MDARPDAAGMTGRPSSPARDPVTAFARRLRAIVLVETTGFRVIPGGWVGPVAAVALTVVVFSLLRFGIDQIYSESLLFLSIALALGLLSRTTGMLLVLGHTIADLIRVTGRPYFDMDVLVGRLIADALLWILVVTLPLVTRWLGVVIAAELHRRRLGPAVARAVIAAATSAVVLWLLVFAWGQAAAYLIRPAYVLAQPERIGILPLQQDGSTLGLIGAAISLALALLYRPRAGRDADVVPLLPSFRAGSIADLMFRLIRALVVLVFLRGLISGSTDVVLLGGAIVAGELIVWWLSTRPGLLGRLRGLPPLIRLGIAVAVTFGAAALVTTLAYASLFGSQFFPLVLPIAVGLLAFRVLLAPESAYRIGLLASSAATLALAAVAGLTLALVLPGVALADNCSGLVDCAQDASAALWTAVTFIAGIGWAVFMGIFDKTPPVISELGQLASPEGAEGEQGAFNALQRKQALDRLADGDYDGYRDTMNQNTGDFYKATMGGGTQGDAGGGGGDGSGGDSSGGDTGGGDSAGGDSAGGDSAPGDSSGGGGSSEDGG